MPIKARLEKPQYYKNSEEILPWLAKPRVTKTSQKEEDKKLIAY